MHASQALEAIKHGKHVFVEKPLAITQEELKVLKEALTASDSSLMVGYNRRFSPHIRKVKSLLETKDNPKNFIMTMNAGYVPENHWTQDRNIGGGRIIGEACHYIDLMRFLVGSKIKDYHAVKIGSKYTDEITDDKSIITLTFEDGSCGSIHYLANGDKSFPKERIEILSLIHI